MESLDRIYRAIPRVVAGGVLTLAAIFAFGRFFQAVGRAVCDVSTTLASLNGGVAEPCVPGEIPDLSRFIAGHGSHSDNCFAAGTPVLTPSGSRPIETLSAGDWVLSRAHPANGVVAERVTRTFVTKNQPVIELRFDVGEPIEVTPGHKFWAADRGWVTAATLESNEAVTTSRGADEVHVVSVVSVARTVTVYNLEVEQTHTYFVGSESIWVHNPTEGCSGADGNGGSSDADPKQRYVVRLQAQGSGLQKRVLFDQATPVTGTQGLQGLVELRNQLTNTEFKARKIALQKAEAWIRNAMANGGAGPPGKSGFTNPGVSGKVARIDVEILHGRNLLP